MAPITVPSLDTHVTVGNGLPWAEQEICEPVSLLNSSRGSGSWKNIGACEPPSICEALVMNIITDIRRKIYIYYRNREGEKRNKDNIKTQQTEALSVDGMVFMGLYITIFCSKHTRQREYLSLFHRRMKGKIAHLMHLTVHLMLYLPSIIRFSSWEFRFIL